MCLYSLLQCQKWMKIITDVNLDRQHHSSISVGQGIEMVSHPFMLKINKRSSVPFPLWVPLWLYCDKHPSLCLPQLEDICCLFSRFVGWKHSCFGAYCVCIVRSFPLLLAHVCIWFTEFLFYPKFILYCFVSLSCTFGGIKKTSPPPPPVHDYRGSGWRGGLLLFLVE